MEHTDKLRLKLESFIFKLRENNLYTMDHLDSTDVFLICVFILLFVLHWPYCCVRALGCGSGGSAFLVGGFSCCGAQALECMGSVVTAWV